jgi:hypothetical protein
MRKGVKKDGGDKMRVIGKTSFEYMLKQGKDLAEENKKKLKESGGMCIDCGKSPHDAKSSLNRFKCKDCNKETEEILKGLRGSGFSSIRI